MDKEPLMGGAEQEPSRIVRAGRWISNALHEAREQLRTADLNPHEGRLRASASPSEYLPKAPDYPPMHDNN
jgi:hypothetical protein